MRHKHMALVLAFVFLAACGDDDADEGASAAQTSSSASEAVVLGGPVESRIPPAVVPENAELDESLSRSNLATYLMPLGVSESDVLAWYEEHMSSGRDFMGLRWLEALPPSGSFGEDWYWCSAPAQSLDVSFGQNDPGSGPDDGRAFVSIAIQDVSDGACG